RYCGNQLIISTHSPFLLALPGAKIISLDDHSRVVDSWTQTSGELDDALGKMADVFQDMLNLAQVEKTMQLLAEEIEKTRRRVNALEYIMIPELEGNIKYISMKLEENENATKVRLLKVKEMVLQDAHNYKQ
ncbi:MAG: V-type ATP synthase subunit D, partial [Oscillospiraceae bacterium]|nr:V-type ATP synthase subunit D [Oscillospiraceae bacterium]